jgi:hypothetical protein
VVGGLSVAECKVVGSKHRRYPEQSGSGSEACNQELYRGSQLQLLQ